jgi:uncharacterized membrane protein (DUF4010 family)
MDVAMLFQKFGLALGLGLLVGLQRERSASALAGFRTFPLVTMLGTLTGVFAIDHGWGLAAAGLLSLAGLCVMGNIMQLKTETADPGLTTEAALMLMYCLGVYLATGEAVVAVVIGAVVALLLHLKPVLHGMARQIGEKDFRGIMQFAAIALIILPLLPDMKLGPYGVLNPRKIWTLVVLITGLSLAGYLLYRFRPAKSNTVLAGLLGGLVSSTATTVSFARRTREVKGADAGAALVILISGTVVFARVLALVAVTAPAHFLPIAPPLATMMAVMAAICVPLWWSATHEKTEMPQQKNPTELRAALVFTALFAGVLVAIAAARDYLGDRGLYAVAFLSGLADMDAITLSSAALAQNGSAPAAVVWRLILLGSLANIIFKLGSVAALGSRGLLARVSICFGIALAAGTAALVWWP